MDVPNRLVWPPQLPAERLTQRAQSRSYPLTHAEAIVQQLRELLLYLRMSKVSKCHATTTVAQRDIGVQAAFSVQRLTLPRIKCRRKL